MDEYVKVSDACHAILDYIATEEFEKSFTQESRAAVMSGLGLACCVIMAKCTRYFYYERGRETNEDHT